MKLTYLHLTYDVISSNKKLPSKKIKIKIEKIYRLLIFFVGLTLRLRENVCDIEFIKCNSLELQSLHLTYDVISSDKKLPSKKIKIKIDLQITNFFFGRFNFKF